MPAPSSWARPTCPSGPTSAPGRRRAAGAPSAARPTTPTASTAIRAARAPARRRRWRPASRRVAVGTETDGSIICPAAFNSIVGVKPSLGLVSRSGIVPISAQQDTAGPIARNVTDATVLLEAMTGPDPDDPVTTEVDVRRDGRLGRRARCRCPRGRSYRRLARGRLRRRPARGCRHGGDDRPARASSVPRSSIRPTCPSRASATTSSRRCCRSSSGDIALYLGDPGARHAQDAPGPRRLQPRPRRRGDGALQAGDVRRRARRA